MTSLQRGSRVLRNAFFSRGRELFGLSFAVDYLRAASRAARRMGDVGGGAFDICGFHIPYPNHSHALFLLHEIFVNAEYEFQARHDQPQIIDCGANIGMSVLFFKALYPQASIIAFEPDPASFARLTQTIETNGLKSVIVEHAAVTETPGSATLFRNRSDVGSIVASLNQAWGGKDAEAVRSVRLSDRIVAVVDFLKIDVEGAEYGIVRDLAATGKIGWIREIAIEYHHLAGVPDALPEMRDTLRDSGFLVQVTAAGDSGATGMVRARRCAEQP